MAFSGIFIPGNAKAAVMFTGAKGEVYNAVSQNRGSLQVYRAEKLSRVIKVNSNDQYAIVRLKNGRQQKVEFNFGASYLSQSSRILPIGTQVVSVEIVSTKGEKRITPLQ